MEEIKKISHPDKTFSGKERKNVIDELTEIARDGFGSGITKQDVEEHVMPSGLMYLIKDKENVIGFSLYDFLNVHGKNILFMNGAVIKKNYQQKGIYSRIKQRVLSEGKFDFAMARTQSPVAYAAIDKLFGRIYPDGSEIPDDVKEIAELVAKDHLKMKNFNRDTFVEKGTYGKSLYTVVPRHERSNDFFDNVLKLDYKAGDSVLLVAEPIKETPCCCMEWDW